MANSDVGKGKDRTWGSSARSSGGMAYYGVGDGWCFSSGAFADHVKLMFVNGATLDPVPPVTPIGMGKATRGVELASLDDVDEVQVADWMRQITSRPGVGGKKK
ncbi:hypothetical protein GCM10022239_00870 [Leifsonia bigeumensis]|uniref:YdhG-like domain-containing protein n=2 Tax=Leifsonella bigeumensis TaxID=433643 RepID=A0ABP7F1S9_9MICO